MSIARARYNDGQANVQRTASGGVVTYEDVTIAKPHDPLVDGVVEDFVNQYTGGDYFNFTIRPARRLPDSGITPLEAGFYLGNCRLLRYENYTDVNTGDGETIVMVRLTFSVESVSRDKVAREQLAN